jgi:hypothetical protein
MITFYSIRFLNNIVFEFIFWPVLKSTSVEDTIFVWSLPKDI